MYPFDCTAFVESGNLGPVKRRLPHSSYITVIAPTDCPKSICYRFVINNIVAACSCNFDLQYPSVLSRF